MAKTVKTQDGSVITDGEKVTLTLRHGETERVVKGVVRAFEHVERVYDDEGIAVGKTSEIKWEVLTGDPQYPAIGFLPENVLTRSG
jgi:hypothetical protein